tara:strand:- start:568 stop:819 length:252 start_codon:yes stop_codon:yes gene_type:complete
VLPAAVEAVYVDPELIIVAGSHVVAVNATCAGVKTELPLLSILVMLGNINVCPAGALPEYVDPELIILASGHVVDIMFIAIYY